AKRQSLKRRRFSATLVALVNASKKFVCGERQAAHRIDLIDKDDKRVLILILRLGALGALYLRQDHVAHGIKKPLTRADLLVCFRIFLQLAFEVQLSPDTGKHAVVPLL